MRTLVGSAAPALLGTGMGIREVNDRERDTFRRLADLGKEQQP
jgi:hypothetical protein